MQLAEALVARLDAGATAAIAQDRISWLVRDQGSGFPAVVLQTISGERPQHLDGFEDMATVRVQASCMSEDYLQARALAEAVIADLVPEAETGDVLFWRASADEPRELLDTSGETPVHLIIPELIIRWGRAA